MQPQLEPATPSATGGRTQAAKGAKLAESGPPAATALQANSTPGDWVRKTHGETLLLLISDGDPPASRNMPNTNLNALPARKWPRLQGNPTGGFQIVGSSLQPLPDPCTRSRSSSPGFFSSAYSKEIS